MTGREVAAWWLLGIALMVDLALGIRMIPTPSPASPPAPASPTRTIHLFDWQGGDLEVCQCVPGRVEPGPKVKRAGP
jgi:hypothetical protein